MADSVGTASLTTGLDAHRARRQAKRRFEAWAASYDRSLLNHFLFGPAYRMVVEELGAWYRCSRQPFSVLDVGCGTGTLAAMLSQSPWPVRVVGMDYALAMCAQGASKAAQLGWMGRAGFAAGDSEHLPFADGSFDWVTCSNSFHHYPNQAAVLKEMRRVVRPGGGVMVIDGFRDNIVGWVTFDVIIQAVEKDIYHAPWSVMHDYFVGAGLSDVRRRKFNFWFPSLATIGYVPKSQTPVGAVA